MSECTHCYGTKSLRIIRNGIHCGMKDCDYCSNDNKKQSPVEWLMERYYAQRGITVSQFEEALQMEREEKEKLFDAVQAEIRQINNLYPHIYQGSGALTELSLNIAHLKNKL